MEVYKEMPPVMLALLQKEEVWSMESMEKHGAGERSVEYVGSVTQGNRVCDYYQDDAGEWWYKTRRIVDGCIVSMESCLFGRDMEKGRRRRGR